MNVFCVLSASPYIQSEPHKWIILFISVFNETIEVFSRVEIFIQKHVQSTYYYIVSSLIAILLTN